MARSATTLDAFAAIAEPKRRAVMDVLVRREMPVNDLVESLGWPQPMVSKHLGVLREVGLVSVRDEGRQRVYRVNAGPLKAVHEWTASFERLWSEQLESIKKRAEQKAKEKR